MRLDVRAFGLTCAVIAGFGLFVLTWWMMAFDGATGDPTLIGRLYRGYTVSPVGSVIGFAWAFADGLVGGVLFSAIYNMIAERVASVV
jgi:hypothetical protein